MSTWETRSTQDPLQRLDAARATVAAGQRNLFRAIVDCERAETWRSDGCRDMAQGLAGRLGISNWTARRWVAAAHALEAVPHIAAALETGTLSVDQVVELTRLATPETEQDLIRWARRVSPAAVRRRADLAGRPDLSELREATGARYLRGWWYDDRRCYGLEGLLSGRPGHRDRTGLEALRGACPGVPRGPRRRRREPAPT